MRELTLFDHLINHADLGLRTLFGNPEATERPDPALAAQDADHLDERDMQHTARLMRVNHTGEVCAQALYQGQSITARDVNVKLALERSAQEENDHLIWCKNYLNQQDMRTSALNPLFYLGSLAIGVTAGALGDKWSLGFLDETEKQVGKHLDQHLRQLPEGAHQARAVIEQMAIDEADHADKARKLGAAELPQAIKSVMQLTSKIMTLTTYRI